MTFFLHGGRRDILKIVSKWIDQDSTYFSDFYESRASWYMTATLAYLESILLQNATSYLLKDTLIVT